jgi:hypothetical protein
MGRIGDLSDPYGINDAKMLGFALGVLKPATGEDDEIGSV